MSWTFGRSGSLGVDDTSITISVTVNSGENLLSVAVTSEGDAAPSSVTYGGVALTQRQTYLGGQFRVTVYDLINPTPGTANLVANITSGDSGMFYQVWKADGTVSFDKTADVADDSSPISGSLTTAQASELLMGYWADDDDNASARTIQASSTERQDTLHGSGAGDYGVYATSRVCGAAGAYTSGYSDADVSSADGVLVAYIETVVASAALTGTATASITEADIVTGGKTIILTLTNDTWIAAGALSFDAQRDEIIAGLDSAQSELLGWDNVVKALQGLAGVVRTSDTVVTITLDAQATYDITAQETITATIPGTALTGGSPLVAAPAFTIDQVGGAVVKDMIGGGGMIPFAR